MMVINSFSAAHSSAVAMMLGSDEPDPPPEGAGVTVAVEPVPGGVVWPPPLGAVAPPGRPPMVAVPPGWPPVADALPGVADAAPGRPPVAAAPPEATPPVPAAPPVALAAPPVATPFAPEGVEPGPDETGAPGDAGAPPAADATTVVDDALVSAFGAPALQPARAAPTATRAAPRRSRAHVVTQTP